MWNERIVPLSLTKSFLVEGPSGLLYSSHDMDGVLSSLVLSSAPVRSSHHGRTTRPVSMPGLGHSLTRLSDGRALTVPKTIPPPFALYKALAIHFLSFS